YAPSPQVVAELREFHDACLTEEAPWFSAEVMSFYKWPGPTMLYDLDSDKRAFSAVLVIVACLAEAKSFVGLEQLSLGDLEGYRDIMLARQTAGAGVTTGMVDRASELVTDEALSLLLQWTR